MQTLHLIDKFSDISSLYIHNIKKKNSNINKLYSPHIINIIIKLLYIDLISNLYYFYYTHLYIILAYYNQPNM